MKRGKWAIVLLAVALFPCLAMAGVGWGISPVFTLDTRILSAPGGFTASDGTSTSVVSLAWSGVANATGYLVKRNTMDNSDAATALGGGVAATYADASATPGVLYYYWVSATNIGGPGLLSSSETGWRKLAPPANVMASDRTYHDRVAITWNAAQGATGYEVYRGTSADTNAAVIAGATTGTSFNDTNATAGVAYSFWVKATCALGASDFSEPASGRRRPVARNDYNGDGISDLVVFDQNTGKWYIIGIDGAVVLWDFAWGWPGAWPVPGDYDGDGLADMAVFDQNTGWWYVITMDGRLLAWAFQWGWPGAWPVPGDYDGDGKSDCAVFDQNSGWWYVITLDSRVLAWAFQWGWPGAWPVPGDYNGDSKSDCAVFDQNSGWWYAITLENQVLAWAFQWGWPGAWPVSGDYDGDGISDCAVFDQNSGWWYVIKLDGTVLAWAFQWGWPGAWPLGAF